MKRRTLLKAVAVPALLAAGGVAWGRSSAGGNSYYSGPVSDHFDGERFFNPGNPPDKPAWVTVRAVFLTPKAEWPDHYESPFRDVPPPRVEGAGLRLTLIGHASFLLQAGGQNILIDPVFSERASPFTFMGPERHNPPGIAFDDLPKIHAVLVTHNHYDHLDTDTLSRLAARDNPRVLTPLGNDTIMRNHDRAIAAEAYDWGARVELAPDVAVTFVPTAHWSARWLGDRRKALWASFVIHTPAGRIYHVGDTAFANDANFTAHGREYGPFRLAVLPIGAYEPRWFMKDAHMNPDEAVKAFQALRAEQAVGHHWGTFQLTAEPVDAPERALADALAAGGIGRERFVAFRPGQVLEV
ncbi:MBL fold metallo-hydrolase [Terrihabitans sp. B22-R8]|uniref:MBL fold metallo-hydrolase n=1 Tax=Terrihabitans sp. B22-R8 TaxID=3425128 RepID=UPI00403C2CC5